MRPKGLLCGKLCNFYALISACGRLTFIMFCFIFSEEEFKKYYRMPGWGKPLYEMKEAEIPQGDIPNAFDWRDKGMYQSELRVSVHI